MAKVFSAAVLLSGILAVSGCAGLIPGLEGLGSAGGGYPSNGEAQAYPYDPGGGGGYAQPVQPYYQPQPYAYSGNPEVYQPVPQGNRGYNAGPSGRWIDRRQQRPHHRIHPGRGSGQFTPGAPRRFHHEPGRTGRMEGPKRTYGHPNGMHKRSGQNFNQPRYHGGQPGPSVQPRTTGPGRPTAHVRSGGQPRAQVQPRTAAPSRASGGRPAHHSGRAR